MPSGPMAAFSPMIDVLTPRCSSNSERSGSVSPMATSTALMVAIAATRFDHRGGAVTSFPASMPGL